MKFQSIIKSIWLFFTLIGLLPMGACQLLQPPFKTNTEEILITSQPEIGPRSGLIVTIPKGIDNKTSTRLASLVAANLRDRDIGAIAGNKNQNYFTLKSLIKTQHQSKATKNNTVLLNLSWQLQDPLGDHVGAEMQIEMLSSAEWAQKKDHILIDIAAHAAPLIEHMIERFGDTAIPQPPLDSVFIYGVDGASKKITTPLLKEFIKNLQLNKVPVVKVIRDTSYILLGSAYLESSGNNQLEDVYVEWTVIRPDGRQVGLLKQHNEVKANEHITYLEGMLESIARAAARNITTLLEEDGMEFKVDFQGD